MSCKQLRGDFNYAWPTAQIAVMGAKGAIEVLYGKEVAAITDPEAKAKFIAEKEEEYNHAFANPYKAASYGYIDDVIERTGLGTAKVLSQLTVLEIKGYIRRIPGRRVSLNTAMK